MKTKTLADFEICISVPLIDHIPLIIRNQMKIVKIESLFLILFLQNLIST